MGLSLRPHTLIEETVELDSYVAGLCVCQHAGGTSVVVNVLGQKTDGDRSDSVQQQEPTEADCPFTFILLGDYGFMTWTPEYSPFHCKNQEESMNAKTSSTTALARTPLCASALVAALSLQLRSRWLRLQRP